MKAMKPPMKGEAQSGAKPTAEEGGEDMSHMPMEEMVAKHGPAQEINLHHDHESDEHEVKSMHGGKMHKSMHGSAREAHMHAMKAAGMDDEMMGPDMGQMDGMEDKKAMSIPGMSKMGY